MTLDTLLLQIEDYITHHPKAPENARSLLQVSPTAKILIVGQAPGNRAYKTGLSWNDASGTRLRRWLGLERDVFYDKTKISLLSMGFFYPGLDKYKGDNPPLVEDAEKWHEALLSFMPDIEMIFLVGSYAQQFYLKEKRSVNERMYYWKDYLPRYGVMPHPSWRNNHWFTKNIWFERDLVPVFQERINKILNKK